MSAPYTYADIVAMVLCDAPEDIVQSALDAQADAARFAKASRVPSARMRRALLLVAA